MAAARVGRSKQTESPDFGLLHDATTALWNAGRHDDALQALTGAIESSQHPLLLETRAKMYAQLGRDDDALADWRRACEVGGAAPPVVCSRRWSID